MIGTAPEKLTNYYQVRVVRNLNFRCTPVFLLFEVLFPYISAPFVLQKFPDDYSDEVSVQVIV